MSCYTVLSPLVTFARRYLGTGIRNDYSCYSGMCIACSCCRARCCCSCPESVAGRVEVLQSYMKSIGLNGDWKLAAWSAVSMCLTRGSKADMAASRGTKLASMCISHHCQHLARQRLTKAQKHHWPAISG